MNKDIYGGRGLPLKILQFFKDLIKNKRKNKLKLKVKWNVTLESGVVVVFCFAAPSLPLPSWFAKGP